MIFAEYLRELQSREDYSGQIEHVERIPRRSAVFADPSAPLRPDLAARLRDLGIDRLYSHQAAAVDAVRAGNHVIVVTGTASGKTLCYNIPAVEAVLENPRARALYLFPTKALAQDQTGKLNDLGFFPEVRFASYDGDTSQVDRRHIKRGAHIVLSNPDMLHVGILPYHTSWAPFFSNLKYVVVDEIHTYRGVFGAHVAQVLRRLRRVCALYGSSPQFIACSATIANPGQLMENLTGLEAAAISGDGSPQGRRTFAFWNPPEVGKDGSRRSAHVEAANLFADLVTNDIRNITFAKARKSAELILRYARQRFDDEHSDLGGRIKSYRAGYTAEERREIERGLFNGHLIGVTATNALEVGIDVGGLDATVLTGYPGTIASTWQQAGRAGRSTGEALTILIGLDGPLDQYLMRHPEYFFGRTIEHAIVDPNNRRIVSAHLLCAAYESPLSPEDLGLFGMNARDLVEELEQKTRLVSRGGRWYFRGEGYPAGEVNIRSASAENYEIRERDPNGRLIGTVDSARVYQTVHPGAVYLHQGESYIIRELDDQNRLAIAVPADANYYTEPRDLTTITVLSDKTARAVGTTTAHFGEVVVASQVLGYRVKQLFSDTVREVVDLDLPEQIFETEAFWYTIPPELVADMARRGLDLCGAIHAAEHASIGMMPLLATCDRWDIGGVSTPHHPDTGLATVFIYDGYPGGIGIAQGAFERLDTLLTTTLQMISECPCEDGCPSCIQSPKCGNNNEPLDKAGAIYFLRSITTGANKESELNRETYGIAN